MNKATVSVAVVAALLGVLLVQQYRAVEPNVQAAAAPPSVVTRP
jgi:hypothetical protein